MIETAYENDVLCRNANLFRLTVSHVFCGTYLGSWQSSLPVNRLIYIFESGEEESRIHDGVSVYPMRRDHWIFIPALHQIRHDQKMGLKLLSVHFNMELYSHLEIFSGCGKVVSRKAPELREDFQTLMEPEEKMGNGLLLQRLLWQIAAEILFPLFPELSAIRKRCNEFAPLLEIFGRDTRKQYTVAKMAAIMKMGRETFIKRFSREMGESPKAFFNQIRASAIARMLEDPRHSLTEVADEFGFSNIFYFSRYFKRYFKITPGNYRKETLKRF